MKTIIAFLTATTILIQNASCNAFQQTGLGLSSSSTTTSPSPAMRKITKAILPNGGAGRHIIPNHRHHEINAQSISRGGGINNVGSSKIGSSLHMMNPNDAIGTVASFNNGPLQLSSIIFASTNLLGFIISILTGSHLHLDLLGTGAFAVASLPTLLSSTSSTRVIISSGAVALWSTKLALFLFFRALKVKTDVRLEDTLSTVSGTGIFWFISLLWGLICSLPHTLGTTSTSSAAVSNPVTLTVGVVLYLLGLATETKADYQKWIFKQNNPGKFCNVGLWSVSQHPNFFGNLLLWLGIFVMNVDSLIVPAAATASSSGGDGSIVRSLLSSWRFWIALLSPTFMWTLFNGQASGSVTNSVELANQKYGSDAAYVSYIKDVPLIVPQILDWLKKLFS